MEKHTCTEENAPRFIDWIKNRGGVAVWRSVNLSNPDASWSTPALTQDGQPMAKPTWQADDKPEAVFTDPNEIIVTTYREVKRIRIAIKRGDSFNLVLTDASSKRLKKALAEAGESATCQFDCDEAVILVPDREITLAEFESANAPQCAEMEEQP